MVDTIIKGAGNSRSIKSVPNLATLAPTYEKLLELLTGDGLPVDIGGLNPAGVLVEGTNLTKSNLLSDASAAAHGFGPDAVPDDMWSGLTPVGSIFWFASQTAPDGYLICDGSAIGRMDYARLFEVIGTNFGGGDGRTTFALPDLRAAFIRGAGSQNGYSATFGNKQEATGISYRNSDICSQIPTNIDKVWGTSESSNTLTRNPVASGKSYAAIRPYNLSLTPIIKY